MNLKVLQWNVWYKENPDNIVSTIKSLNPDIVTAQEIIENSEKNLYVAKYIANKLNYNYFYKEGDTWSVPKNNKTSQGNTIFSRYKIQTTKFHYLTKPHHDPPDANFEGRVYIEASIAINHKLISIATTHLGFSPGFVINKRRKKEVDNLALLIKNRNNYILTGDLNSAPNSYTIQKLRKYLRSTDPNFDQPTWTTKPFDYHGQFKENRLCWRLDYIFVTKDIKVINSQIINTAYSDHLPILLTIDF